MRIQPLLRDGRWLGFGAVEVDGHVLRDADLPWRVRIDTPDGILYTELLFDRLEYTEGGAAELHLRAMGLDGGQQAYRDEYGISLMNPAPRTEPVEDRVTIRLAPSTLTLAGSVWHGFSYQVRFASDERKICRIVSHESWELGGAVDGNTVLHRGHCNMPVYRGARERQFTTYCLKTLDQYGSPHGFSFQQGARGGLLQPFDFQHTDDTALLAYWPKFDAVHSFIDSPEGCPQLRTVDEYRMALTSDVSTTPKHILVTQAPLAEHTARNLWWEVNEHVFGAIRQQFGIKSSRVRPETDQGQDAKIDNGQLYVEVDGEWVASQEMLYALADRDLPKMADSGIRRLFPINIHETDVTVLGMQRKLDSGLQGDLHCASVCGTHRFFPADFWGGIKAWRYLVEKAHGLGMEVGAWFAPHFSPRAAIFKEHPDWLMTGADTRACGGGYGFHTIVTADWHTGVYQWVLDDLRRWHEEGGVDYLFSDSWPNLALLPRNYAADMRHNLEPLGRLYHDLQQVGIHTHLFEGISGFGATRIGIVDVRGDKLGELQGVAGQNDFDWWVGHEDMACDMLAITWPRNRAQEELAHIQFRLMANRACAMFKHGNAGYPLYAPPDWEIQLNHVYEQALPHMTHRKLLPDGLGVCWNDGCVQVLWAYRNGAYKLSPAASVEHLQSAQTRSVAHAGLLSLQAGCVYRIR